LALKGTKTPGAPSLSTFETRESMSSLHSGVTALSRFRNASNRIEIATVEDFDHEAKRWMKIACDMDG
jgi:hypothetical protein